jgi:lipid-A-disaccharide synthase
VTGDAPLVFLIAGEPSGDLLGARLMASLKAESGGRVRFAGLGGPLMQAEGLSSLFDTAELAVMGIVEVLGEIPRILRRIRQTVAAAIAARPDVFVSIDSPSFSLEVAKKLKGRGFPLVHYVAPSVWAWKAWRAKHIAGYLDHLMTLLPFEPAFFERHGLAATFVGHSAVEAAAQPTDAAGLRARLGLAPDQPLLAVLPGSRRSEVKRLAPVFGQALALLRRDHPGLAAVVPTVPNVAAQVRAAVAGWPVPTSVVEGQQAKYDAFAASRAAIAASGTVGLELAVAGLPAVMAYRVSGLSAAIARRALKIRWVSIASLVLDRLVQPECIQENCTPAAIVRAVAPLLLDTPERRRVVEEGHAAARLLGQDGEPPSRRAARVVLSLLGAAPSPGTAALPSP